MQWPGFILSILVLLYVTIRYTTYWYKYLNIEYPKQYIEYESCKPNKSIKNIKVIDLNPNRNECQVRLSDKEIIQQCKNESVFQTQQNLSLLGGVQKPPPLTSIVMHQELQLKYERRVAKGGCSEPKGMWGNPFNSRCTIVTMAKIGRYKPNDLILDWGSGCGHQATWMAR